MSLLNSSALVRPAGFYIVAFQSFPFIGVYMVFLALVYAVTLLFNTLLMSVIALHPVLHTPKFYAVANLALIDVLLNTSTIPGMIRTFLAGDDFVPFNLCLLQMFVHYTCLSLESYSLAILAYDRLVAICFPLRQHQLNSGPVMLCVVGAMWLYNIGLLSYATAIMTRLSYCGSLRVFSYFCDYAPVFRLACGDVSEQWGAASASLFHLIGPFVFVLVSYASIVATVFRMKSLGSRVKALATCMEHLILVAIFYFPLLTIYLIGLFIGSVEPDQRMLSLSLASCLPPAINPIVYSLKTKEIKTRVVALVWRVKIKPSSQR